MDTSRETVRAGRREDGEDTRARLVQAALVLFGQRGFDGASTREICDMARANISAIPYYFDSKEGLYRAVADHILQRISEALGPTVQVLEAEFAQSTIDSDQARALLKRLVVNAAELLVGSKEAEQWAAIILREQMAPTFAFDVLYEGYMKRMFGTVAKLIAIIQDKDPEDPSVLMTGNSVSKIGFWLIVLTNSL